MTARVAVIGVCIAVVGVVGFFILGADGWPWYQREPLRLGILLATVTVPWLLHRRYRRAGMR